MNRGERLRRVIDEKGYNINKLSRESGVAYSTIDSMIKRDLKHASIDNVLKICRVLGIPASYLTEEIGNLTEIKEYTKVPILGEIACGDPIYVEENFVGYHTEPKEEVPSGHVYYLEAKGDSMEPSIPEGSLVLIREQPEVENGEVAAVLLNGDTEATLKRVSKQDGYLLLMPDNKSHKPIIADNDNPCKIIGKAIRVTFNL